MDYKAIILKGYFHENDKSYLKDYFYREYKKAEQQHYKADEFFSGLLKVVEGWRDELKQLELQKKIEIRTQIRIIKSNEFLSEQDKKDIEHLQIALDDILTEGISNLMLYIHLKDLPNGKSSYDLRNADISIILENIKKAFEIVQAEKRLETLPAKPIEKSQFSVLQWGAIFYYADSTKLLTDSQFIKTRMEQFMEKHQITTTYPNLKTKYYEAKKRINKDNNYPINKLEEIIPFLKENYKLAVTKVETDIEILDEYNPDY